MTLPKAVSREGAGRFKAGSARGGKGRRGRVPGMVEWLAEEAE